jgi:NAD(P)-dependent dehydrogenase (short-subunit alcohol dehydrogenase family)
MKRPIEEQVVVITGASSGIGRETALAFGKRGSRVMLAARNKEALEEVASEIELMGSRSSASPNRPSSSLAGSIPGLTTPRSANTRPSTR